MTVQRLLICALGLASLAACDKRPADKPVDLHHMMVTVMTAQAQQLWDVSNATMDHDIGVNPALMTKERWAAVESAGNGIHDTATMLANAKQIIAAARGQKIDDEGQPGAEGAADVQGYIDRDRQGFSDLARALASTGSEVALAARKKDSVAFGRIANDLDEVCDGCHRKFWFPEANGPRR